MIATNYSPLTRSLLAAGLALAGTLVTFTATTSNAHAAGVQRYQAQLSTALEAPKSKIINGVVWDCKGDSCAAEVDGSRAIYTCVKVVKAFGPVTSFTGPKGALSAEELAQCNAKAA